MPLSLRHYTLAELKALLSEIEAAIRAAEGAPRKRPGQPAPASGETLPADTAKDAGQAPAAAPSAAVRKTGEAAVPRPSPDAFAAASADLAPLGAAAAEPPTPVAPTRRPARTPAGGAPAAGVPPGGVTDVRESAAASAPPPEEAAPPPAAAPAPRPQHGEPAIRYMHPANRNMTWTGLGPQPEWLTVYLSQGGSWTALENTAQKFAARAR